LAGRGTSNVVEAQQVLVPSHASFMLYGRADGYRVSDPILIMPLIAGEKKTLTLLLRRELVEPPVD
jgi:hypothetical protein